MGRRKRKQPSARRISSGFISELHDHQAQGEKMVVVDPPLLSLKGYDCPYPKEDLKVARRSLIDSVQDARGPVWNRLKYKLGILPSGERVISTKVDHSCWLPDHIPYAQWCGKLTLLHVSGDGKMKTVRKSGGKTDIEIPPSQLSQEECSDADSEQLQAGTSKRPDMEEGQPELEGREASAVFELRSDCKRGDCLCPSLPSVSEMVLEGEDRQLFVVDRKRKSETLRNECKKVFRPSENNKSSCATAAEGAVECFEKGDNTAGGNAPGRSSVSDSFSEKIITANSVTLTLSFGADQTQSVAGNEQTAESNMAQTSCSSQHPGSSKSSSTSSPTKLKSKVFFTVAEDMHGNKRKLDADLEVKNGKAVLKTSSLKKGGSLMYKCDYCKVVEATAEGLSGHLTKSQHPSGSQCIGQKDDAKGLYWPHCIIELSSVQHPAALFKTVVPVCPVCHKVYDSVDACTQHTHADHGLTGAYSLRDVSYKKTFPITKSDKCMVCKQDFSSYEQLSLHWKSTKHVSFQASGEMMVFFHCPYCSHMGSDFQASRQHVISEHKRQNSSDACGAVNAVYLGGPTPIRHLMPLFPTELRPPKDKPQTAASQKQTPTNPERTKGDDTKQTHQQQNSDQKMKNEKQEKIKKKLNKKREKSRKLRRRRYRLMKCRNHPGIESAWNREGKIYVQNWVHQEYAIEKLDDLDNPPMYVY